MVKGARCGTVDGGRSMLRAEGGYQMLPCRPDVGSRRCNDAGLKGVDGSEGRKEEEYWPNLGMDCKGRAAASGDTGKHRC